MLDIKNLGIRLVDEMKDSESFFTTASKILLLVFNPLCVAVYLSLLLLFGRVVPLIMPAKMNFYVLSLVFLNTIILPTLFAFSLRVVGLMNDYSFTNKRERYMMLLVVVIGYGVCAWNFNGIELLFLFRRTMVACMACVFLAALLYYMKRVSFVSISMGVMTGVIWILVYAGYDRMLIPFCIVLFLSGLVVSSLTYLSRNTLTDSVVSYLSAVVLSALVLMFS